MTEGTPRNVDSPLAPSASNPEAGGGASAEDQAPVTAKTVLGHALPQFRPATSGDELVPSPLDSMNLRQSTDPSPAPRKAVEREAEGGGHVRPTALDPGSAPPYEQRPLDLTSPAARRDLATLPEEFLGLSIVDLTWFVVSFVIPVLFAAIYYFFIMSDQYVVEVHYTVRTPDTAATATASSSALSLLTGSGQVGTVDQNNAFVLDDYTKSSQAARDLDARINLRGMYTKSGIDFLSRLKSKSSDNELSAYWKKMSYSLTDPAAGFSVLRVRAFTPRDAYRIADTMLSLYTTTVNDMGQHSRSDSVRYAEADVVRQRAAVADLTAQMTALRDANNVVDPMTNTVASNIQVAGSLRASASQTEAQIDALTRQLHNPNAPQIGPLRAQLAATQQQLSAMEAQIRKAQGEDPSLSNVVAKFEKLTAMRNAVEVALATSVANLQSAQTNLDSQRIYVDAYVRPFEPQTSTYPNRLISITIFALVCFLIWVVGLLLAHSVIDHS